MRPPTQAQWAAAGRWAKDEAAEWVIGSWALIIGWAIVGIIFFNLLQMDGHFSRGLGEGSGIDPGLFQNIGWMYGLFGAVFLVLCVRFEGSGLKATALSLKALGTACIFIIMMHAVGFGLKAMESKRATATAIEDVAEVQTESNTAIISQLRGQLAEIDAQLAKSVAPINDEIKQLDNDRLAENDARSDALRERRTKLEDAAIADKREINTRITGLIESGGHTKAASTDDIAKSEKWAPLFVGLAQLFTWNPKPTDWSIYIAGVAFNIVWMWMAHLIVIVMPPALYKLHLKDAQRRKFSAMGKEGGKTTARRNRVRGKLKAIEDLRKEKAATASDLTEELDPIEDDDLTEDDEDDEPEAPRQAAE